MSRSPNGTVRVRVWLRRIAEKVISGGVAGRNYCMYRGDALQVLRALPDKSAHLCVTDPPYFLHGLGADWNAHEIRQRRSSTTNLVKALPAGMKFDPAQGRAFQTFMHAVSVEIFRVLKPGGFYVSFSQARLYHRLGVAVEDAGFELRDMLAWKRDGHAKAFSQNHFVQRMKLTRDEKARIIADLGGRKTPQLRPQVEPMTLAQKPREGTFVENWLKHRTGLVDVSQTLDGMFPGNIMEVSKPSMHEKGEGNDHPTPKPVALIEHIVNLFSCPGQTVLDPFLGSGSHGVAATNCGRAFVGIERDPHYWRIAQSRIEGQELILAHHTER